jgi:hypothetical protein
MDVSCTTRRGVERSKVRPFNAALFCILFRLDPNLPPSPRFTEGGSIRRRGASFLRIGFPMTCTEIKVGGALLHGSPESAKRDVLERYGEPYVRLGHVDAIAPFFMSIACVSAPLSWLRVAKPTQAGQVDRSARTPLTRSMRGEP